ncbi:MAG TPA: sterol desaturase family protein [Candidatus Hydrogenedentes bacterium]|nr:sterol desaturase family protein [Candidatus Hydrogenedentota bacterium]HRK35579.1 sterol desaturase family protein [Candidatus Hydrogenedentota bacterium]
MEYEPYIRLTAFAGVFAIMAAWELAAPRRFQPKHKGKRWFANIALVVIDTALVRLIFPFAAVVMAEIAHARGWGLLNLVTIPNWLSFLIAFVALDAIIYAQHVLFHYVPFFWRFHRVHHSDIAFDVSTGLRFHPGEIIVSMCIKFVAIAVLGPPAIAVLVFEVVLNATSMFNHSNVRMPVPLDRVIRLLLVTPDMHRVHHSVLNTETNSNFGFNLPWWDRIFGTYTPQPRDGHRDMVIGLSRFRDAKDQSLPALLIMPAKSIARDPRADTTNSHE